MCNGCYSACDVCKICVNNILPMLIMILINIILLYFIQITHTDDFPSTGTRLVLLMLKQDGSRIANMNGTSVRAVQKALGIVDRRLMSQEGALSTDQLSVIVTSRSCVTKAGSRFFCLQCTQ